MQYNENGEVYGATSHYGIRTKKYKLMHFYDELDFWELYNLENDPSEMRNLYSDPDCQKIVLELQAQFPI
ncbi:MAG: DUF4976 domain-containing protein [Bacteroidetes bacterium]|nr:DUF4976 domain-containing protein [Bacteroidota bacterium]